jgi:hypothetical protein
MCLKALRRIKSGPAVQVQPEQRHTPQCGQDTLWLVIEKNENRAWLNIEGGSHAQ